MVISAILIAIFLLFLFFKKKKNMENLIFDNEGKANLQYLN